jgi:hypothetical protein
MLTLYQTRCIALVVRAVEVRVFRAQSHVMVGRDTPPLLNPGTGPLGLFFVTVVLHLCHSGVNIVLRWCYSGVTAVLQWCWNIGGVMGAAIYRLEKMLVS